MEPVVPTRITRLMPMRASSSRQMAVDGPPIPVEQTNTGLSCTWVRQLVYSRWLVRSTVGPMASARLRTRPGSPGSSAVSAPMRRLRDSWV
jgi:hypothetical protein